MIFLDYAQTIVEHYPLKINKMKRKHKIMWFGMLIVGSAFIYTLYGTDLISPKVEYIRLKNGKEFHNVTFRTTSDIDVYIDGEHYTNFDIDSLAW